MRAASELPDYEIMRYRIPRVNLIDMQKAERFSVEICTLRNSVFQFTHVLFIVRYS